ncbi:MAG: SPFH domain-containing protein [Gemmatimonadaceae bacterium]
MTVTFRPDPARIYQLATQIGRQYYEEVIRPPFVTITRAAFAGAISAKLAMQEAVAQKAFEVDVAVRAAEIARTQARGEADAIRIRAEGEAQAIVLRAEAPARAQASIARTLSTAYLQYKAFDTPATRYYFVPTNRSGLPVILSGEPTTDMTHPATVP